MGNPKTYCAFNALVKQTMMKCIHLHLQVFELYGTRYLESLYITQTLFLYFFLYWFAFLSTISFISSHHFKFSVLLNPIKSFELLSFAVFGQFNSTQIDRIDSLQRMQPEETDYIFELVLGVYLLVSVVVLINLLVAMMSDTYRTIQVFNLFGEVDRY